MICHEDEDLPLFLAFFYIKNYHLCHAQVKSNTFSTSGDQIFIYSQIQLAKKKRKEKKRKEKKSKLHIPRILAKIWKSAYFQRKSVKSVFFFLNSGGINTFKGYWYLLVPMKRRDPYLYPLVSKSWDSEALYPLR